MKPRTEEERKDDAWGSATSGNMAAKNLLVANTIESNQSQERLLTFST
jgi:hypothetical protein